MDPDNKPNAQNAMEEMARGQQGNNEPAAAAPDAPASEASAEKPVNVINATGHFARQFTPAQSDAEDAPEPRLTYLEKAESYAKKIGGKVVTVE